MRFGNQKISVSPRFFIIIGMVAIAIYVTLSLHHPTKKVVDVYSPAFPAKKLSALSSGFLLPYIRNYGLIQLSTPDDLINDYEASLGLPFRFKAYIPDNATAEGARPDLFVNGDGWDFEPASFINPNQTYTAADLESDASNALTTQPLELGFLKDSVPVPGYAYEFTGLLWWRSDLLQPNSSTTAATSYSPSPVLLIDNWAQLSNEELAAPTTEQANINLVYQEGPLQLDIKRIEWSAGNQMRICLAVQNVTQTTQNMWNGLNGITVDFGQGTDTPADESAQLQASGSLQPGQTVPGYVDFGSNDSDPNQSYTFRMPAIDPYSNDANDTITLSVPQNQIKPIGDQDTLDHSCTSDDQSASSTGAVLGASGSDFAP
jgi:hypothetical protein